ncbi:hypothetical protein CEP52_016693 [Fusarium oligoseptatum]|uniref:Protein kinase domain-containing protein n=1 Tax=Fusarium oligoseptatum TaxID=2604345 RepID=A0A428S138_9HYPO|nr:hypothetical protein CEP52_016693 [Fusarium oligoseptatum]
MSVQPKVFPTVGFEALPVEQPIEEENLPNYKAARYYPAHIGQVLQHRYQIVGKVGYGGGSTVWACRDLDFNPGEECAFDQIEDLELTTLTPRKVLADRCIYLSYELGITHGPAVITDFGAARLGNPEKDEKHTGDVMPGPYRAPEVIMGAEWDSKIDMWSLGVMVWDLFEGGPLFRAIRANNLDDELHLAEMVSLLGPPPKKFLERHEKSRQYWDLEGVF